MHLTTRHLLQSAEWSRFQRALGRDVIERSGDGWQYMAIVEQGYGPIGSRLTRLYAPYGPSYHNEVTLHEALADLEEQARQAGADYIRVEPTPTSEQAVTTLPDFVKLARPSQPPMTLLIDLTRPFDEILADCTKTNRYLWRKTDKYELEFNGSHDSEDLKPFLNMLHATTARTGAIFHEDQYYQTLFETLALEELAGLYFAFHHGKPVASLIYIDDHEANTRSYMYAGSFDEARELNAMAPLLLHTIKDAQDSGLEVFDMFGVAPEGDADHRWAGFSQFKRSFGGEEYSYIGTWERPIRRGRYAVLQLLRKLQSLR